MSFNFSEMIEIDTTGANGVTTRKIRVAYPCKPKYYGKCLGFGHETCGPRPWAILRETPLVDPIITLSLSTQVELACSNLNLNLNSNSNQEGTWHTITRKKNHSERTRTRMTVKRNEVLVMSKGSSSMSNEVTRDKGEVIVAFA